MAWHLRGHVQGANLSMYGAVAVLVGVAAPDQTDIDGDGLIQKPLFPLNVHQLHQVFLGALVQLAAAVAGIGKGVQAHVVMVPMLWAAMSRYIWVMTPWGRL